MPTVLFDPVGDLLADAVASIEEWQQEKRHIAQVSMPNYQDSTELTIVVTFMDLLRCSLDLFPGEFADRWRPRLLEKIRQATGIAQELRALQREFYADAARAREEQCQAEHGCSEAEWKRRTELLHLVAYPETVQ